MHVPISFTVRNAVIMGIAAAVVTGAGIGISRYLAVSAELAALKKDPTKAAQVSKEEIKQLVHDVSGLMELPPTGDPTVATVADVEKLRAQPFFSAAKNGDKVLIFSELKKAVLYRPDTHKIIDIAPLTTVTTPSPAAQPQTQSAPKFALRNGTATAGLTKKYEETLKKLMPEAVVAERGNTVGDFTKSLIADAHGQHKADIAGVARTLSLTVSELPKGEATAAADVDYVIILGSDSK